MKISIITVCYNCVAAIESTIESVVSQTYGDIEYILIDGNSSDGTSQIIRSYADKISYSISEKDSGIYNAMNKALLHCSGDYVLFLNCGDRLHSRTIIEELIDSSNGEDIIYGDMLLVFKDGRKVRKGQPAKINRFLFIHHTMFHQATLVKKKLYDMYGTFNEEYLISADLDFFLRVVFAPGITKTYIPKIITNFDMHGISHSRKTFALRQKDRLRILKKHMPTALYLIARLRYYLIQRRKKAMHKKLLFYIDTALHFLRGK